MKELDDILKEAVEKEKALKTELMGTVERIFKFIGILVFITFIAFNFWILTEGIVNIVECFK